MLPIKSIFEIFIKKVKVHKKVNMRKKVKIRSKTNVIHTKYVNQL